MPRTDFDGDGQDDLIFQSSVAGERSGGPVMSWLGQSNGGLAFNDEAGIDPWTEGQLVGVGDFNGDGRSDTLWLNNREIHMSHTYFGGAFYFHWSLGFVAMIPLGDRVVGIGDFNGDGGDDILFQGNNGSVSTWLSNGNSYVFGRGAGYSLPSGFEIIGTGDFNGDGRDDALLRAPDGVITNWLGLANGGFQSNHTVAVYPLSSEWHVAGIGDFNNDARDDLLLRNEAGIVTEWLATANGGFASNHAVSSYALALSWHVRDVGDYNGDGYADLALRSDDGIVTTWLGGADGALTSNHAIAGYALGLEWQIQTDFAGSGLFDIFT